ncbi:hypothetical protein GCM10023205_71440 [Yinghuangia aomiensis]|uniref:Uncharacterized protein n=1 Tax=Yinghuangia aomiensis TaxID=676205 RepID=A0ABP9I7Q4_9ACTN
MITRGRRGTNRPGDLGRSLAWVSENDLPADLIDLQRRMDAAHAAVDAFLEGRRGREWDEAEGARWQELMRERTDAAVALQAHPRMALAPGRLDLIARLRVAARTDEESAAS